ncbi:MAG: FliA/WhiG family RNA polymerase sigma factor [bacterium]
MKNISKLFFSAKDQNPVLEEDDDLWNRYKKRKDYRVKEVIIKKYMYLVKYVVSRIEMCLPTYKPNSESDDLVSCGIIGLMDAIEKFDPDRGIKFKTYAISRVRGAILDELRALDWVPRSVRQKARQLEATCSELENELKRQATDTEMAGALGISMDDFYNLVTKVNNTAVVSLDKFWTVKDDDQAVQMLDLVEDFKIPNPEEESESQEKKEVLQQAIERLPERERTVVSLYYFEELTLKQIGDLLDVSESRVSQMHTKAILRLKGKLSKVKDDLVA